MDRKIISRRIADIQNNLSRLNNNICAMVPLRRRLSPNTLSSRPLCIKSAVVPQRCGYRPI